MGFGVSDLFCLRRPVLVRVVWRKRLRQFVVRHRFRRRVHVFGCQFRRGRKRVLRGFQIWGRVGRGDRGRGLRVKAVRAEQHCCLGKQQKNKGFSVKFKTLWAELPASIPPALPPPAAAFWATARASFASFRSLSIVLAGAGGTTGPAACIPRNINLIQNPKFSFGALFFFRGQTGLAEKKENLNSYWAHFF